MENAEEFRLVYFRGPFLCDNKQKIFVAFFSPAQNINKDPGNIEDNPYRVNLFEIKLDSNIKMDETIIFKHEYTDKIDPLMLDNAMTKNYGKHSWSWQIMDKNSFNNRYGTFL